MPAKPPPFTLTPIILKRVSEISEQIGRLSVQWNKYSNVTLRRINHIRSIQGSLAIEGNTLSTEEITAILDGKRVIAPPKEIREAQNAAAAYQHIDTWHATSIDDLLSAHQIMMHGLIEDAGQYRKGGVGVMSGDTVVHMAPQAHRVPRLMANLLAWLEDTDIPVLVASCVFHYEFEFIHPFSDGNGRIGRLWQSRILTQWQPIFKDIPVESLIHQHQQDYYAAIRQSTVETDSAPFIEFMLGMIAKALVDVQNDDANDDVYDGVNKKDQQLLNVLKKQPRITQHQLAEYLKLSKSTIERRIRKLKQLGKLQRIGSDKTGHWQVL